MNIIVIELIVVLAAALGFGFWQLYDVNRELRKHRDAEGDRPELPGEDARQHDDEKRG